jgi:hypothetical protein
MKLEKERCMFFKRFSWLFALLLVTSGCVRGGGAAFGFGMVTGAVLVACEAPYPERVVVVQEPPVLLAVGAPPAMDPPREPRRFDATAAKVALERANLAECQAQGLPSGYVHLHATFARTGAVTKVVVDAPSGLSPDAVACVGHAVAEIAIPPYEGDGVSLGVSWFVP